AEDLRDGPGELLAHGDARYRPHSGSAPRMDDHELLGVPGKTIKSDSVELKEMAELSQRCLKGSLNLMAAHVNEHTGEMDEKLLELQGRYERSATRRAFMALLRFGFELDAQKSGRRLID